MIRGVGIPTKTRLKHHFLVAMVILGDFRCKEVKVVDDISIEGLFC